MTSAIRQPAVAGRFYPGNAQRLRAEVETFTTARAATAQDAPELKIAAQGCVVPHAGYMYSGAVAGAVYRRLDLPRRRGRRWAHPVSRLRCSRLPNPAPHPHSHPPP